MPLWLVIAVSCAYLGALFAVARFAPRSSIGRRALASPYVYTLSLAVYATAWTYYGSVGRAARDGVGFLPIYLGPTLAAALWWLVLRKMIRISKSYQIGSLADFIAARYGKSALLGGLSAAIAVVGLVPYIALQLKAVSDSFALITGTPLAGDAPLLADSALYIALVLALFTAMFSTQRLAPAERHEGVVATVALESLVELSAFVAVGLFVTFGMFGGLGDIFAQAAASASTAPLLRPLGSPAAYVDWFWLIVLSMLAITLLPRQFQMAVIENIDEVHVGTASWLFPLYLLVMNLFVVPIALGGLLYFGEGGVDPDTFVLTLPLAAGQRGLALWVFLGGLSAATAMIIVETLALSTMVVNNLIMPLLLRLRALKLQARPNLVPLLLAIRRGAIVLVVLLGYGYFRLAGEAYALVAIGLISFAAVAQFAPALLGGMFWRGATRAGAICGLLAGIAVWGYTLLLPALARSGWLSAALLGEGPWGVRWLAPTALFGLSGLDEVTHAMIWSMLSNVGAFVGVSLFTTPTPLERQQALRFVEVFRLTGAPGASGWHAAGSLAELTALLERFLGVEQARAALAAYAARRQQPLKVLAADAELVQFIEAQLAGVIGAASARVAVASVAQEAPVQLEALLRMLDETSQAIAYSRKLEQKSAELEAVTRELRAANARLRELDALKDEFISTVSHELRTPLTSIRAVAEILEDDPEMPLAKRAEFLRVIVAESERLSRLIEQILTVGKLEAGSLEWRLELLDVRALVEASAAAVAQLARERGLALVLKLPATLPPLRSDRDRLMQVLVNLLSNALKYARQRVELGVCCTAEALELYVADDGPGIPREQQAQLFKKFSQVRSGSGNPQGSGLGLYICRQLVTRLGGDISLESAPGEGSRFWVRLPLMKGEDDAQTGADR